MVVFPEDASSASLSEPETRLLAAARAGKILTLGLEDTIRAAFIRALICAAVEDWPVAAEGVRIVGGRIAGRLALAGRTLQRPLWIDDAEIPDGIDLTASRTCLLSFERSRIAGGVWASVARIEGSLLLNDAMLKSVCDISGTIIAGQFSANSAIFDNPGGEAINAQDSSSAGMFLRNATLKGGCNIAGATITGQFSASGAIFDNPRRQAIDAQSSSSAGMFLRNATLKGVCSINNTKISGQFSANGATFDNPGGKAINAQGSSNAGMFLRKATLKGGFDIKSAKIRGHISATGATFSNPDGKAIDAQGITSTGVFLDQATLKGICAINRAVIAGQFSANRTTFDNPNGSAMNAQSINCVGMFLDQATLKGVCDIAGAAITMQFSALGTTFDNPSGNAIRADLARIGVWLMRPGSSSPGEMARPTRLRGTLLLARATIDRHFEIIGADLAHQKRAFDASGIEASGTFLIAGGTRIAGGAHLTAARIYGRLDLTESHIVAAAQVNSLDKVPKLTDNVAAFMALDLNEARIDHLVMPATAETRPRGIVDLSRARVGTLTDYRAAWPKAADRKTKFCAERFRDSAGRDADHLVLDGLEYEHLDNPDGLPPGDRASPRRLAKIRRDWLHAQSCDDVFDRLRPQPWRHLAKILAAQGYTEEAQRIVIERRVAERYAAGTRWTARALNWLLHGLADYGFNPWKTLGWSVAVIAFCAVVYDSAASYCPSITVVCADETVFVRTTAADFVPAVSNVEDAQKKLAATYPAFDPLAYSLDVFLPFFDVGTERFWRVNTTTGWGLVLYYFTIIEQIAGAILVSLVVTGFTGLLTRNEA